MRTEVKQTRSQEWRRRYAGLAAERSKADEGERSEPGRPYALFKK